MQGRSVGNRVFTQISNHIMNQYSTISSGKMGRNMAQGLYEYELQSRETRLMKLNMISISSDIKSQMYSVFGDTPPCDLISLELDIIQTYWFIEHSDAI